MIDPKLKREGSKYHLEAVDSICCVCYSPDPSVCVGHAITSPHHVTIPFLLTGLRVTSSRVSNTEQKKGLTLKIMLVEISWVTHL